MAQWHRLINFFHRTRVSHAIDEELQFHIDERVDELMAEGMSEPEARHLASRQFGNATLYREKTRNLNVSRVLEDIVADAAYAVRSLRRTPAFTTSAVLTLALGIGATTAIYSVMRTVWLRPLPFRDSGRVVRIWETNLPLGLNRFSASTPNYLSWCERATSFESLIALQSGSANLTGVGDPERVASLAVTARFFDTLGVRPILGRTFAAGEDRPGQGRVVLLSDRLWRQRYGGDPKLIGRTIQVNGENRTVVGVVPLEMAFANDRDIWEPLTLNPSDDRGDHRIAVLGRLRPGIAVGQAEAELNGLAAQLDREFPNSNRNWRVRMLPVLDWIVDRETRTALIVLTATAGLLLMIACINVANLLLARASSRVREFGIRRAVGAGGGRLVRQLTTESLVLACAGGGAGLLLALAAVSGLRAILAANIPRVSELSVDFPALGLAFALTLASGLLLGLAPAWSTVRTDVRASIQESRGNAGAGRLRLRQILVAGEFALATVLVAGASLLLASFQRLQSVTLGFEPRSVLTARISLPEATYSMEQAQGFYRQLEAELKPLAGIDAVGITSNVPFGGGNTSMAVARMDDAPEAPGQAVQASWRIATPGYFRALRIPLLRGRQFREQESAHEVPVLLDENLVRRLWPDGRDPIGRLVRLGTNRPMIVAGVVGNIRQLALTDDPAPVVYLPTSWSLWNPMIVVMRTAAEPAQFVPALRRVVAKLDRNQPVFDVRTMDDLLDSNSASHRLNTFLVGAFAVLALALGVIGIAGVVSYSVIQRTPEMAVRMALGATPRGVIQAVTASGMRMCAAGLAAGLIGAYALGQTMAGLLFQVKPNDPAILGVVAAVLLVAALAATWVPASRIARIDPVVALRRE